MPWAVRLRNRISGRSQRAVAIVMSGLGMAWALVIVIGKLRVIPAQCRTSGLAFGDEIPDPKYRIQVYMTQGNFHRWMYRGQHPNWIARIQNTAWAAIASLGVTPNYLVTLEVTGRKSGQTISLPVVVAIVDGQRYLVSMLGDNAQWVQNVRAAGGRAVIRSGGHKEVHLEEVPADQRAPILKAYLKRAPGARPHVPVNKDAALGEFQKIASAFPVFRVTPKIAV